MITEEEPRTTDDMTIIDGFLEDNGVRKEYQGLNIKKRWLCNLSKL